MAIDDDVISNDVLDELAERHGLEYIKHSGGIAFRMEEFDDVFDYYEPHEILEKALKGHAYGFSDRRFDMDAEFFGVDEDGRLTSIEEQDITQYIKDNIAGEDLDFLEWCIKRGYIEDV